MKSSTQLEFVNHQQNNQAQSNNETKELKANFFVDSNQKEYNKIEYQQINERDLTDLERSLSDHEDNNLIEEEYTSKNNALLTTSNTTSNLTAKQNRQNHLRVINYKKQPIVHKYEPIDQLSHQTQNKSANTTCQCIAQFFCFTTFLIVLGLCIFDIKLVEQYFNKFILWVRSHPYLAIGAIDVLYTITLMMTLPITLNHIMLGFTYSQVFESKTKGFLFTIPISMSGVLTGSLISFSLSRYLFRSMVTQQIEQSPWIFRNFKAIDSLLRSEGKTVVALLRLTFAPFGISNYILGVTSISLADFMIGTCSYALNCALQIFIGCSFYSIQNPTMRPEEGPKSAEQKKLQNSILIIEIIFSLLVTTAMGFYAKQLVQQKMDELNNSSEEAATLADGSMQKTSKSDPFAVKQHKPKQLFKQSNGKKNID